MPTNLNALIRYKEIDKCLRNRYVPCTIERLQEACSEALGEKRGIYKRISERTIREDLRVMKSDLLGFNAPIGVEGGYYFYVDKDYSIFNATINEKKILKQAYTILLEVRGTLNGKGYLYILEELARMTGEELPREIKLELSKMTDTGIRFKAASKPETKYKGFEHLSLEPEAEMDFVYEKRAKKIEFMWKRILELV